MKQEAAPVTIPTEIAAVITYLPNESGYFAHRLEIVQACLKSIRKHAGRKLPVLVWDNGSCNHLLEWLRYEYKPEYLFQSANIGKVSTLACILRMFPPTTLVAYSDDDMLHYPGWWDAQDKLLRTFQAGVVSGYPTRVALRWGNKSTLVWAKKNAVIHHGNFLCDDWERDYARSVGLDPISHLSRLSKDVDMLIEYMELWAYPMAQHCQFLCQAGKIAPFVRWDHRAMAPEKDFDIALDEAGLLRLTTKGRYTRHMGNVIDDDLRMEMKAMQL